MRPVSLPGAQAGQTALTRGLRAPGRISPLWPSPRSNPHQHPRVAAPGVAAQSQPKSESESQPKRWGQRGTQGAIEAARASSALPAVARAEDSSDPVVVAGTEIGTAAPRAVATAPEVLCAASHRTGTRGADCHSGRGHRQSTAGSEPLHRCRRRTGGGVGRRPLCGRSDHRGGGVRRVHRAVADAVVEASARRRAPPDRRRAAQRAGQSPTLQRDGRPVRNVRAAHARSVRGFRCGPERVRSGSRRIVSRSGCHLGIARSHGTHRTRGRHRPRTGTREAGRQRRLGGSPPNGAPRWRSQC